MSKKVNKLIEALKEDFDIQISRVLERLDETMERVKVLEFQRDAKGKRFIVYTSNHEKFTINGVEYIVGAPPYYNTLRVEYLCNDRVKTESLGSFQGEVVVCGEYIEIYNTPLGSIEKNLEKVYKVGKDKQPTVEVPIDLYLEAKTKKVRTKTIIK